MIAPSVVLPACANWIPGISPCERQGMKACGNCKLVVYCEVTCQKAHWPEHKKACKSPMGKETWRPAWDCEGREPPWATGAAAKNWHNPFGVGKDLWGNTPALDVLNLEQNEGLGYRDDVALLFAASGDLRHVVKTIASLPDGITQHISVTMNDREFDVVARNAILLLLALTAQDFTDSEKTTKPLDAVEALIHIWYSASIHSNVLSLLQDRVKPLIADVCSRIAHKPSNILLGKTWEFSGRRTLRLVLKQRDWVRFGAFLEIPQDMTYEDTVRVRTAVTLAPERTDYRERWYFKDASPTMRIAKQRFREDGLLLPFGHPRIAFDIPNPTLFHSSRSWPMDDKADPSDGWPILDVQQTPSLAQRDWYGKLFIYLHSVVESFLDRLENVQISFDLYNVDVKELPRYLEGNKYTRLEVANICDAGYDGIRNTLSLLSPLLQSPLQNPHATLITLFINAVKEVVKMGHQIDEISDMEFLTKYLPSPRMFPLPGMNDADMLRIWDARDIALDGDKYFDRYMEFCNFEQISADLRVEMKKNNTIVEKWPTKLKLQPGQKGAQEEFRLNLGFNFTNTERYVEWRRVDRECLQKCLPRPAVNSAMVSILENTRVDFTRLSSTKCANCGTIASIRCKRCMDSPKYESTEPVSIVYCNRDCQITHWPNHKAQCNVMQRRKKLLRIATILKATLLAYRECVFDVDIEKIEFREDVLRLQMGSNWDRPSHTPFPSHLTTNVEYREAALANNQCTLAMALLGPLARHLLAGVSSSIISSDIAIGKPIFSTKLVSDPNDLSSYIPPHTILILELKNSQMNDEKWIIDAAGCQFGFRDVLAPFKKYFEEKECRDLDRSQPYEANETKDIDYFFTLPFMTTTDQQCKKLTKERAARLHFAAFVKTCIDQSGGGFNKYMLSGSMPNFQARLNKFIGDLKVHMTEFIKKNL
ncbi:hypothetical protein B0O99DRAFT_546517 [Bisporella sp. PMI_857]|nr:hypothetical protein B0O99DRAFT_546517 [Bisporella sp. PMI_857]